MGSWEQGIRSDKVHLDRWERDLFIFLTDEKCREIAQKALVNKPLEDTRVEVNRPRRQNNPKKRVDQEDDKAKSDEQLAEENRIRNRIRKKPIGVISRVLEEVRIAGKEPDPDVVGAKIYAAFQKRKYNNSALYLVDYHEICACLNESPNVPLRYDKGDGEVVFLEEDDLARLKNMNAGWPFSVVVKSIPLLGLSLLAEVEHRNESKLSFYILDTLNVLELKGVLKNKPLGDQTENGGWNGMLCIEPCKKPSRVAKDRTQDEFRIPIGEFDRYVKIALTGHDHETKDGTGVPYTEIARGRSDPFKYMALLKGYLPALGAVVRSELERLEIAAEAEQMEKREKFEEIKKPKIDEQISSKRKC